LGACGALDSSLESQHFPRAQGGACIRGNIRGSNRISACRPSRGVQLDSALVHQSKSHCFTNKKPDDFLLHLGERIRRLWKRSSSLPNILGDRSAYSWRCVWSRLFGNLSQASRFFLPNEGYVDGSDSVRGWDLSWPLWLQVTSSPSVFSILGMLGSLPISIADGYFLGMFYDSFGALSKEERAELLEQKQLQGEDDEDEGRRVRERKKEKTRGRLQKRGS